MIDSRSLEGKAVLVTGAGRGIGRAIALEMARQGARVVVNDAGVSVNGSAEGASPADEVVQAIREAGGEAVANGDSVAEYEGAERMVEACTAAFGRIDAVVNNAGILRDAMFFKMTPQDWDAVIKVHLYGSFNVSRAASEQFKKAAGGAFVHMTSTSGLIGNFGQANYASAKLALVALSKSIAMDMQRYNCRSNCIAPWAWSRMVGSIPTAPDKVDPRVEMAKTLTPDKIAVVAAFLASDDARDVNGQVLGVRKNEIFLMGQSRPLRSVHRSEGWTQQTLANHLVPALKSSFVPLERSADVFSWDPV